jgi:hypothetical protein
MGALLDLAMDGLRVEGVDSQQQARHARQRRVERQLREHPDHHVAVEATEAGEGRPVLVTVAVRRAGQIVSGEYEIPSGRWDRALFSAMFNEMEPS